MNRYEGKMRELFGYLQGFRFGTSPMHVLEAQILEAEEQLGEQFPEDYREFVRDFGGFSIQANIPVRSDPQGTYRGGMGTFLGLGPSLPDPTLDLVSSTMERYGMDEDWTTDLLLIAYSDSSSSIALTFKGPNKGKVYFADWGVPDMLLEVADSFDEFMFLLRNSHYSSPQHASATDIQALAAENELWWKQYQIGSSS